MTADLGFIHRFTPAPVCASTAPDVRFSQQPTPYQSSKSGREAEISMATRPGALVLSRPPRVLHHD
jgi:hypothetical protein